MREGWQTVKLPLCLRQVKIPKKVPRKSFLEDGAYPIISQERDPVNGYWDEAEHAINVDRPLVAYGDHTQAVKYIDFDFVVGADGLKLFLTNDEVLPRYFYYYLRGNPVKDLGYARHYRLLKELDVHYPPLPEQERIVSILDKAFEGIDKAIAQTEQNLASARELFESYLNNIFTQKGEGWVEKKFGEVCEIIGGSQPPKSNFIFEPKEGYIRLIQVRDYRTDKFITYIPKEKAKRFCSKTDLMIGRYGPPIFGIFRGLEGAYNVALMKAVPNEDLLLKDYFYWFLKTRGLVRFVEKTSKRAAGQDGVRKERLYEYVVPIPPHQDQERILTRLDKLKAHSEQLEALYTQKLNDLKELKQSLLQQAFAGELTKEDAA